MRNLIAIMLILTTTLLFTGCWDRVELNDIAIVTAVGMDKNNNGEYCLTMLIAVPKNAGGGATQSSSGEQSDKPTAILIGASGTTILEAYHHMQKKLPRAIIFNYIRFILIGERLAQDGVADVLDFFTRYRQSNLKAYLLFTKEDIPEVLGMDAGLEESISEVVYEEGKMKLGIDTNLNEFLNMLNEEGMQPIAAQLSIVPFESQNASQKKHAKQSPSKSTLAVNGAAIFHKDKLVGWLPQENGDSLSWLRDKLKWEVLALPIPEEKGGGLVGLSIRKASTLVTSVFNQDSLSMNVAINAQAVLSESTSKMDLSNTQSINYLQNMAQNIIITQNRAVLDKIQHQLRSDVVGFGSVVYRKNPEVWRNHYKKTWDEEFPKLAVQIDSTVTIRNVGYITNTLTKRQDEFIK